MLLRYIEHYELIASWLFQEFLVYDPKTRASVSELSPGDGIKVIAKWLSPTAILHFSSQMICFYQISLSSPCH